MHKKFLDYIKINDSKGANQDWLLEWDMRMGGCAAVTACDLCMYLARKFHNIYPFDYENLNRDDFLKFAAIMKPYLTPRYHGIDFLEIYVLGLSQYWHDVNFHEYRLEGLSGIVDFEIAKNTFISQINNNLPVPFLLLNHKNIKFDELQWHWFMLDGYEFQNNSLLAEVVTYGESYMIDFYDLWDSGQFRKGGIIRIFQSSL